MPPEVTTEARRAGRREDRRMAQVQAKKEKKRAYIKDQRQFRRGRIESPSETAPRRTYESSPLRAVQDNIGSVQNFFKDNNEVFDTDATPELKGALPSEPSFPVIIFILAITKDVLDWPANLSVVLAVFASVLSFVIGIIIFLWLLGKLGFFKKQLLKWAWKRFIVVIAAEIIPGLNMLPWATVFVYLAHKKETKLVRLLFASLERLQLRSGGK